MFRPIYPAILWLLAYIPFILLRVFYLGLPHDHLLDDAYITLRYSHNLLADGVLHWNSGQPVFGITTLLYPLLLVSWSKLLFFVDLETAARLLNPSLEYLGLYMAFRFFSRQTPHAFSALLLALASMGNVSLLSASSGGMETPLFVLLLFTVCVTVVDRPRLAMTAAGLMYLTRPEGIIVLGMVGLWNLSQQRWGACLWGALLFASYHAILWSLYGSLVPGSVAVKSLMPQAAAGTSARYLFQQLSLLIPLGSISPLLRLGLILPLIAWGIYTWKQRHGGFWILLGFVLAYLGLYSLANPPMWFWYGAPFVTAAAPFFFWGIYQLLQACLKKRQVIAQAALVILLLSLSIRWTFLTEGTFLDIYTLRVSKYREVVKDLCETYPVDAQSTLLTHEIGVVGFAWPGNVFDAVGLVNPSLVRLGMYGAPPSLGYLTRAWLEEGSPDFILIQGGFIDERVRYWPRFYQDYELLYIKDQTATDGSGNLEVYKKRSIRRL